MVCAVRSCQKEQAKENKYDYTKWLTPHIKSTTDVTVCLGLHVVLLVLQLIEGYWILRAWGRLAADYWNWRLEKCQWAQQFARFIMLLVLGLLLGLLLFIGLYVMIVAVRSINDLRRWEARSLQRRDNREKQRREE